MTLRMLPKVVIVLALMALPFVSARAQETEGQPPPVESAGPEAASQEVTPGSVREGTTDVEEEALRLVEEILQEQQLIVSGQNFVYQAAGRRDPFRNLLQIRQRAINAPAQRPAGLPGFLVGEVQVSAVAQYQGRWHAMLVGIDQRTYFAQVGTQLYDGRIVEINDREVLFEQEVEDMMGARSTRQVVKRLNSGAQEQ